MKMQTFYQRLTVKPSGAHQRRLARLTHATRNQILDATSELTWLIWNAETPGR